MAHHKRYKQIISEPWWATMNPQVLAAYQAWKHQLPVTCVFWSSSTGREIQYEGLITHMDYDRLNGCPTACFKQIPDTPILSLCTILDNYKAKVNTWQADLSEENSMVNSCSLVPSTPISNSEFLKDLDKNFKEMISQLNAPSTLINGTASGSLGKGSPGSGGQS